MAETNASENLNGEKKANENKTPDEKQAAPVAVDFKDTGGSGTPGEQSGQKQAEPPQENQPQTEKQQKDGNTPKLDSNAPPAPVMTDDKKAAEKESEKQPGEKAPPTEKNDKPVKPPQTEKAKPDKPEKPKQSEKSPPAPKGKQTANIGGGTGGANGKTGQAPSKEEKPPAPAAPSIPEPPKDATRPGEKETIVYIDHAELHPFKNHPFKVRDDNEMKSLVDSVKERGFDQAALVRPREEGGYEIVAGHRRQQAAVLAGYANLPCVVRKMTDEEAVLAMTESNFTYRSEILASERAQALKMQLDAIKRQGERFNGVASGDIGKRSNEIVAEKNKMGAKTVQRYIALNKLVPDMMKLTDEKKVPFMTAFEMSYIKPKNQEYIAMTIGTEGSAPSLAQAQRMRELDSKGILNGDVIDGIMLETKKEDRKVIISSHELEKYFGLEKSPKEMKDTILKLLDEYKTKNPLELDKPDKKKEQEK